MTQTIIQMKNETDTSFHQSQVASAQTNKEMCGLFSRSMCTQQSIGLRMKKFTEANPFIGAEDTGAELL